MGRIVNENSGHRRVSAVFFLAGLALKEVRDKEPDIRRPFRKAAHEIRIPVGAEGYIDPD
jgi:hypothetical protein